jgi:hypothetical protein
MYILCVCVAKSNQFTTFEAPRHLCGEKKRETQGQRRARERLMLERIRAADAHVVLLQEVSAGTLAALGDRFHVHMTLGLGDTPGTAVVVRQDVTVEQVESVAGSEETGGHSKSATVVTVQVNGTRPCA